MSVRVECNDVTQRFGPRTVLDKLDWRIQSEEIAGLLGASGAGKTSLLRIIAGLDRCTSGSMRVISADGSTAASRIGMVFQNLGLWPHLTAEEHLLCVLASAAVRDRGQRTAEVLSEVQLPAAVWKQRPAQLSGGEAQRLALARALATDPQLLLLDEPLAQLDSFLRADLLALIRRIARERCMTTIYVTHSWPEAAELCRQVAVLDRGRIEQTGSVDEVFFRPKSPAVARLTGPVITFPVFLLRNGLITTRVRAEKPPSTPLLNGEDLVVRPQQLRVIQPGGSNTWRVGRCVPHGACWSLLLECEAQQLQVAGGRAIGVGQTVGLELTSAEDLHAESR